MCFFIGTKPRKLRLRQKLGFLLEKAHTLSLFYYFGKKSADLMAAGGTLPP